MKYFIYTSHHFTPDGRYELNKLTSLPMCGFDHSSVCRASNRYRGGYGFESRWSPDFFRLLLSNCLNWKLTAMFPSWTYLRAKWRLLFIHVFSLAECGSFNSANDTLTSPGYPSNYPNYMDCEYWVPIPPGMAARIDFITFDVESHLSCR